MASSATALASVYPCLSYRGINVSTAWVGEMTISGARASGKPYTVNSMFSRKKTNKRSVHIEYHNSVHMLSNMTVIIQQRHTTQICVHTMVIRCGCAQIWSLIRRIKEIDAVVCVPKIALGRAVSQNSLSLVTKKNAVWAMCTRARQGAENDFSTTKTWDREI